MSPAQSHAGASLASGSQLSRTSQWVLTNPGNPVKTDIELPADPIRESNRRDVGQLGDPPAASSPTTPPRLPRVPVATYSTAPGMSPRSAGQTVRSPVDPLVAARLAMKASGQASSPKPASPVKQLTGVSTTPSPPFGQTNTAPPQRLSRQDTHDRALSPLSTLHNESDESEEGTDAGDSPEDTRSQKSGEIANQDPCGETSPLDGGQGVDETEHDSASAQLSSKSPPSYEDAPEQIPLPDFQSDAEDQELRSDEGDITDTPPQDQLEATDQEQTPLSGSEIPSEELRQSQQDTIAAALCDYSNPTIPAINDHGSICSGRSIADGEDDAASVDLNDTPGIGVTESAKDVDTPHQTMTSGSDRSRCETSTSLRDHETVAQDASDISALAQEFLNEHQIPKKAGYDWFTTLLDWASGLKRLRDAELDDLSRKNANLQEKLKYDAEEKKRLLSEIKIMAGAVRRLGQQLDQANLRYEQCSKDLGDSREKLGQTENNKRAMEKKLHQCQIDLSAKTSESAVYKDEFEKVKRTLEMNRQELQDVRVELKTGQRLNSDLESRIETLSRERENERKTHHAVIAEWSQHAEFVEQGRKDAEEAAAEEEARLNNIIQSLEQAVTTLEAAYKRQGEEHIQVIESLQAQHGGQVQDLKHKHTESTRALQSIHDGQIQDLRKEHDELIRARQLQHDNFIRDLKGEHAENVRRLQSQHSRQIQDLRGEHGQQVQTLESQLALLESQRDKEVKELNDQILQDNTAYHEQLNKLRADCDSKVKTEVERVAKKQQQRIEALEATIVESQDRYYVQISDTSFVRLLESISQQITDLSAGVGRPGTHMFDRSLDPTNYLDRSSHDRGRSWTVFVRSTCWNVILSGFFEFPLGFGCLGSLGEGFDRLYHLYLLFSRPTADGMWNASGAFLPISLIFSTGTSLEFSPDKATNVWRASFFDAFLKAVRANPNSMHQHEGPSTYPGMFKAHVDHVVRDLTDKLLRLSNRQLDSRVPAQIYKVVYDVGILSLQMGSQRAHVMLEPCESGEPVRAGDRFADEGGLAGVDAVVGLMTQPCMVRIGDGSTDTTSEHIIVKGRFVSARS